MSSPTQSEETKASVALDARVKKFISRLPWWSSWALAIAAIAVIAIPSFPDPDSWEIAFLAFLAFGWIVIGASWCRLARQAMIDNKEILEEMHYLFGYVECSNKVIGDSLNELLIYDRDRAIELAEEMNSYTAKALYDSYWREESNAE